MKNTDSKLTLGPLAYNWSPEKRRDFYFRMADEAPIDEVYLGEVVCSKREPFFADYMDEVIARLEKAGKQVNLSTLAIMTTLKERAALEEKAKSGHLIEVNDIGALQLLSGAPFIIGPYVMALHEGTVSYLKEKGARRLVFTAEMSGAAMRKLASAFPDMETEVQIFGRQALAVSSRCYHARALGRDKDHCRMACGEGDCLVKVQTLADESIWTVAGTQTLSAGTLMLSDEIRELEQAGVRYFRLSPQEVDMVKVAVAYRSFLEGQADSEGLSALLSELDPMIDPINGFYQGVEGMQKINNKLNLSCKS